MQSGPLNPAYAIWIPVTTAALIVAAGRGSRAGCEGRAPKQYANVRGMPVLRYSLGMFLAHPGIDRIAVVIHPDDAALYAETVAPISDRLTAPVIGGATRQESVLLGLQALAAASPSHVLIHDAARPFIDPGIISRVLDGLEHSAGVIAAEPVTDTLKRAGGDGTITGTVQRDGLWRAQTPQGFHFEAILDAHRKAAATGQSAFTDDSALAEWAGLDVAVVRGSPLNLKITSAEDFAIAERLAAAPSAFEPRTGTGFDVHRFIPGDHVWLCGIRIDHDAMLGGHSDADAPLHALTDAILGALGEGDIGQHFPPDDPKWKGARSRVFVEDAADRVRARGGRISNVDITILCERPKIGPHRAAMQQAIADMLGLDPSRIGIKATTTEQLGFTGRREGLAAMASATILLPA
jgi:2-C-methyl-D-erythritol 4-phosphate cytidylyltransferase/2-C-methyl-D-erythritol 2,4-cyclodiphosphate synthase